MASLGRQGKKTPEQRAARSRPSVSHTRVWPKRISLDYGMTKPNLASSFVFLRGVSQRLETQNKQLIKLLDLIVYKYANFFSQFFPVLDYFKTRMKRNGPSLK